MSWKRTSMAVAFALIAGGCHSVSGFAGSHDTAPHKLKGPATAAMEVSPTDPHGELKRPARSLLARADREEATWTH